MFLIQWEELCLARGLLIYFRVVTEGVCQQNPCFLETFRVNITRLNFLGGGGSITQNFLLSNMIYYTNSD